MPQRIIHRISRLSLHTMLMGGSIAVSSLMLLVGIIAVLSQNRMLAVSDHMLDIDARIATLSLRSDASMFDARRHEKNFLLFYREFGFDEARSRYVTLLRTDLADVRENLAEMRRFMTRTGMVQQTLAIEQSINRYESSFLDMVDLYGQLGFVDTGLEGQFRDRAHEMEKLLKASRQGRLMLDLLIMRRAEKDFIMRGLEVDVRRLEEAMTGFKTDLAHSALPDNRKNELRALADEYQPLFLKYVQIKHQIDDKKHEYFAAVRTFMPLLQKLSMEATAIDEAKRGSARETLHMAERIVIGTTLGAILFVLFATWLVTRGITKPIQECVDFAKRVALGDLQSRMQRSGRDEFGTLANALNDMADALQEAAHAREQRTTELAATNQALHSEIRQREQAEAAINKINAELEHRIAERTAQLRDANAGLEQSNRGISLLREMGDTLLSCLTLEEAYKTVPKFGQQLFPLAAGHLYLLEASRNHLEAVATWGDPVATAPMFAVQECWALRRGQLHCVVDPHTGLTARTWKIRMRSYAPTSVYR
ncbi:methyl-accepting chemotaxis protein [Sulfuriferula sp. AH1]|uniref:HAMP domain-containing protein n=1 Tax=Sulfuriferula sp. AH1 TaxID=1985873 RepID=UPI0012FC5787|nr:methyl-accepting chemotaxis protein [Sulfuriferula sp. AH1]